MPRKPTTKTVTFVDGSKSVFSKNGNGEGTLYFQESKNAWRASYVLEGETIRRYVQARTRDQAVAKRDLAILAGSSTSKSVRFSPRTTVAEFGAWWLDNEARHRVRSSSLDRMSQRLTRLGPLGERALGDVKVEDLISWQSELLKSYAPKTVADTRTTARQVFAAAVELNLIASNPAERLKPPKVIKRPGRTLTIDEVGALFDATDGQRYGAVVRILFTTGLRVSEALGLSWDDIDLDTGRATVRRAVTYSVAHRTALGPPKTEGATGVHRLAPGAIGQLLEWRERQADERRTTLTASGSPCVHASPDHVGVLPGRVADHVGSSDGPGVHHAVPRFEFAVGPGMPTPSRSRRVPLAVFARLGLRSGHLAMGRRRLLNARGAACRLRCVPNCARRR